MCSGEKKNLISYGKCGLSFEKIHAWKLVKSAQTLYSLDQVSVSVRLSPLLLTQNILFY